MELSEQLVGIQVQNKKTHAIGVISSVSESSIEVNYHGRIVNYSFPACLADTIEIDIDEQTEREIIERFSSESVSLNTLGLSASFEDFKKSFTYSIEKEINYIKATGGKRYRLVDGERISTKSGENLYAFDSDVNLNLPDGTPIKLWFSDNTVPGYVVSCEDFTILIRLYEDLGKNVETVEISYEQWKLLEVLMDRLSEMDPDSESIAYELACCGRSKITEWRHIKTGQDEAVRKAVNDRITFIWGPPGTGKTETLANIAVSEVQAGRRVLMLSYSNVSVDGAILRVASKVQDPAGHYVRYGYPRMKELLEDDNLTSYRFVLNKNPLEAAEYNRLIEQKKRLKRNDPSRTELNKKINSIRENIIQLEKQLIHEASFVATTVSKATIDPSIYQQRFDTVIFDEASMAYIPQVVFAAGLAESHFICLGDFRQLPAIVQNPGNEDLMDDIFGHTGITEAVDKEADHEWLVMLDIPHRMHPDIADFAGKLMYQGMLKTSESIVDERRKVAACSPCSDAAMSLVDLSHMYSACTKTKDGSRINILSAFLSLRIAEKNLDENEVGIITPYNAQSRLLLAMIRDIRERNDRWNDVTCATVHQFQGSEKSVIIYDAVDCYRMRYVGTLLTSQRNDTANRLFNVALTRAKGKFILLANYEFFKRKRLSWKLMFTEALYSISGKKNMIQGAGIMDEVGAKPNEPSEIYIKDEKKSWNEYIEDIRRAGKSVTIDIPNTLVNETSEMKELFEVLDVLNADGVNVRVKVTTKLKKSRDYLFVDEFIVHPITIIDKKIIWFGHPGFDSDFISESGIIKTEYFPCIRFEGIHTARSLQAFINS